jgi:hypothetical protein
VSEVRIYFEGDDQLRPGFHRFFSRVLDVQSRRHRIQFVALNGDPVGGYDIAVRRHPNAVNILILDSEQPLDGTGDREKQLTAYSAGRIFWMIELMEAWFLADREALRSYYGNQFRDAALPGNPDVEAISKNDVREGLRTATRNTSKGAYHKTKHAPKILERLAAESVRRNSRQCNRLFSVLSQLVSETVF